MWRLNVVRVQVPLYLNGIYSQIFILNNMSLLIIGATGTIGRQIAKKALSEGFKVKCLVRSLRKGSFLKEWGAELVYGDLCIKQSLPNTLKGVTCIIDASTTRPYEFETAEAVDWVGKNNLLDIAKQANIKKYIFLSILDGHKKENISFMELKLRFEKQIINSGISYTIFYLPSLFQGVISQYAVSILDQQTIVVPNSENKSMYIDAQDISNSVVKSLSLPLDKNRRIPLITKENWTPQEIIKTCEKFSGQKAKILYTPNFILQLSAAFFKSFKWSWSLSEQLNFVDSTNMATKGGYVDKINTSNYGELELFLKDYFSVMLKKLKELNIKKTESPIF